MSRLRKQKCSCRTHHPALRCSVEGPACLRAVQWSYTHLSHCLTFILCVAAPRPRHGASQLPGSSPVGPLFRPRSPWIRCHFVFGWVSAPATVCSCHAVTSASCSRAAASPCPCFIWSVHLFGVVPGGSDGKKLSAIQESQVGSLGWENPWKRKWQPTPEFLPGKSHEQRRLAGYGPWGRRVGHDLATKPQPTTDTPVLFQSLLHRLLQDSECISLCSTVACCCLSILYIVVYIC